MALMGHIGEVAFKVVALYAS